MSPHLPITPRRDRRRARSAPPRRARRSCTCTRATRTTGARRPIRRCSRSSCREINAATDAVINITTGGGHGMTVDERHARGAHVQARAVLAEHGLDELRPVPDRSTGIKEFKHDWEPHVPRGDAATSSSATRSPTSSRSWRRWARTGRGSSSSATTSATSTTSRTSSTAASSKPPLFVQTIFGILGGIGAEPENLLHMRRTADRLFGDDYQWSILGAGRHQTNLVTMGAIMGGNVRVGLEDIDLPRQGPAGRVERRAGGARSRASSSELSLEIATPDEARAAARPEGPREHEDRLSRRRGQPRTSAVTTNGSSPIAPTPAIARRRTPAR